MFAPDPAFIPVWDGVLDDMFTHSQLGLLLRIPSSKLIILHQNPAYSCPALVLLLQIRSFPSSGVLGHVKKPPTAILCLTRLGAFS